MHCFLLENLATSKLSITPLYDRYALGPSTVTDKPT